MTRRSLIKNIRTTFNRKDDKYERIRKYDRDIFEEARKTFLKAMGIETSDEGNYDIVPIAIVPIPEIDE